MEWSEKKILEKMAIMLSYCQFVLSFRTDHIARIYLFSKNVIAVDIEIERLLQTCRYKNNQKT